MIQDVRRSFGASRHCGVTRVVMNSRSLGAGRQWRGEQLMGQMVDGIWHSDEDLAHAKDGHFARPPTRFRGTIERGGAHPPEPDRYHLYVSLACPWAHRALIVRKLKGLDDDDRPVRHALAHARRRMDLRARTRRRAGPVSARRSCTRSIAAPTRAIPAGSRFRSSGTSRPAPSSTTNRRRSSGSSDRRSTRSGPQRGDLYPEALRGEIDAVNARVYETLNNGVYRAGFATTQAAYDAAVVPFSPRWTGWKRDCRASLIFAAAHRPKPTGAFSRLWSASTPSTHGHFKCNVRRLVDYPALWDYARRLYQWPGVSANREFRPHQGPLLREPPRHQPDRHRAAGPDDALGGADRNATRD